MEMNIYTLNIKITVTWHHDLPKFESLGGREGGGGVTKFFARKGDKPVKGGCHFFYFFTVQSYLLCGGRSKVPFITFRIFSFLS